MTALWTSADAVAATGGRSTKDWQATGVSIDTRSIEPGDLFVALKDIRDGHEFVAQALEKGAAAALVSRIPEGVSGDAPLLLVDDVLPALEAMGRFARARTTAKIVAVTGSVGKTSTKEMLRTMLAGQGHVHAAEKSFNNHWGVPLTLARMPIDSDFAVIEIGMSAPGEIAPLAKMAAPHVAMITTVAPAHLEAFPDVRAIALEKASIFDGLVAGGIGIVNADLPDTDVLLAALDRANGLALLFGAADNADFRATDIKLVDDTTIVKATRNDERILFKVQTAGRHFAMNAIGCLAVAEALGIDPTVAALDLAQWVPPAGRGARQTVVMDIVDDHLSFDLLDDAFNANPVSMAAAIEVLAASVPKDGIGRHAQGRRIAVLGDMLELGPQEAQLHAEIARYPGMDAVTLVHCVGPRMASLYAALPLHQRGKWFETAQEMSAAAHSCVDAGDVILVKGSKGSYVSLVVEAIKKLGQVMPQKERGAE